MIDIVERLLAFGASLKSEELMRKWSLVRAAIAKGDRGSGPRDALKSWIDDEGSLAEAAAEIERLRAALAAERERCAKVIDANTICWTNGGSMILPRTEGDRFGLEYAAAIRALK